MVARLSCITPPLMLIRIRHAMAKVQTDNMVGLKYILRKYTEDCNRLTFEGFREEERQAIIDHLDLAYMLVLMGVYTEVDREIQACRDILTSIIMEDKVVLNRLRDNKDDSRMLGSLAALPDDILENIHQHVVMLPRPIA